MKIYQFGAEQLGRKLIEFIGNEGVLIRRQDYQMIYEYTEIIPEHLAEELAEILLENN